MDEPPNMIKRLTSSRTNMFMAALVALIIIFGGYAMTGYLLSDSSADPGPVPAEITTFTDAGTAIELKDGKPVIRMFSTTWCPHCKWITDTYESVVKEYADRGLIVAHHWELDINDDTLTPDVEGSVPQEEMEIYRTFNPRGGVPTFIFGGKYVRIGNGHERTGDLKAEEAEFRAVIDKLIADSS